ncbi:hypothetical protein AAC387_Pa10g0156 [Persea americana]
MQSGLVMPRPTAGSILLDGFPKRGPFKSLVGRCKESCVPTWVYVLCGIDMNYQISTPPTHLDSSLSTALPLMHRCHSSLLLLLMMMIEEGQHQWLTLIGLYNNLRE